MRNLLILCGLSALFASGLEAQSAKERLEKAPPAVDNALRERVNRFYQAHVDGKWREADAYVAEDTKDFFFAMQKSRYKSCEVVKTQYEAGFKQALVTVVCKGDWQFHNTVQPVVVPITSAWRIEKKQWYWFVDQTPRKEVSTPFGIMRAGPDKAGATAPVGKPPGMPDDLKQAAKSMTNADIRISRNEVVFDPAVGGSFRIDVVSSTPGDVQLRAQTRADVPGLKASVDKIRLGSGETAGFIVEFVPSEKPPELQETTVYLEVLPFHKIFPVKVRFAK
ncbi:MAG: hypothetical protein K2X35_14320 [Bryobacteraceae bacterium]|nr:hypothetical protein [Bryobacteraceae bacterium]